MNNKKLTHIIIKIKKFTIMKILLAFLFLIVTVALICSPLYLVYVGVVVYSGSFWVRLLLVAFGLIFCRMTKPISVITGKDFMIF